MKQTIRLRESELRHMIAESVKRVLREKKEEYDWDFYEKYPEHAKSLDIEDAWGEKEAKDNKAKDRIQIWHTDGSPDGWIEDFPQYDTERNADYDSGYENMYGDRDVNSEYFDDSDYRFTNDEWEDSWYDRDRKIMVKNRYDKNSSLNKQYTESRIRGIIRETISRMLGR